MLLPERPPSEAPTVVLGKRCSPSCAAAAASAQLECSIAAAAKSREPVGVTDASLRRESNVPGVAPEGESDVDGTSALATDMASSTSYEALHCF